MNPKQFLSGLGITIGIQLVINLVLLACLPTLKIHLGFILISILAMVLFCASLYMAARIVVQSSMTRLYIQLVMIAVFIKMFLCLALIIAYKKAMAPVDNSFIWSFLLIYITSTIYEVIFLEKVGRQKNTPTA